MTDQLQPLRDALEAGPTSAFYTHPRDDNKWKENEALALACTPERLNALLARLDAAEADAKRWRKAQSLIAGEHACCGTRFVFNMLKPMGGANIMQGSVSEHFTNAIDAALSSAGGV